MDITMKEAIIAAVVIIASLIYFPNMMYLLTVGSLAFALISHLIALIVNHTRDIKYFVDKRANKYDKWLDNNLN